MKIGVWSFVGLGMAGLLLGFALPDQPFGAWFLNIVVLLGAVVGSTVLHEAGHAIAGSLADQRIFAISIGKGAMAFEFKWAGWRWQFRAFPFGGFVLGLPRRSDSYRSKASAFILGGPAANAFVALLTWRFLWLDRLVGTGSFVGFEPMRMIILCNCLLLVFSLWPHRFNSERGRIANDALLLWQVWWWSSAQVTAAVVNYYIFEADQCRRDRKFAEAQKWAADGLREFPGDHYLQYWSATLFVFEGKLDEARTTSRALMEPLANDATLLPRLLNNIAYVDALLGRQELLPEADDFSRRALENQPRSVYFQGTRGTVLVELGKYDEGVALLESALRKHPERWGKAINACYLGIAAARRGYTSECQSYFALARKLDPHCPLLAREKERKGAMAMKVDSGVNS